ALLLTSVGGMAEVPANEIPIELNPQDSSLVIRPAKDLQVEKIADGGLRITYKNEELKTYRRVVLEKKFNPPVQATAVGFTLIVAAQEEVRITAKDTDGVLGSETIKGAAADSAFVTLDQFRNPSGKTLNGALQEISISFPMLAQSDSTSIEIRRWFLQR
ncbi:MAG: hypothetical protein ACOYM3_32530, partial [Terrimicrobiaceae bacterium]